MLLRFFSESREIKGYKLQYFSSFPKLHVFPWPTIFAHSYLALSAKALFFFFFWEFLCLKTFPVATFFCLYFSTHPAEKCFTRNLKSSLHYLWLSCWKKSVSNTNMSLTLFAFRNNIQQSGNAFLVKKENRWNFLCPNLSIVFALFFHFRCVKCDECSRLARSRRTRFDCSYFICNCLHCSSDNLSKAFT